MNCLSTKSLFYWLFSAIMLLVIPAIGQTFDTISNWDGISQEWYVSTGGSEVVSNPAPDTVNASAHCFKMIPGPAMYDYMIYDMAEPAHFDSFPRYRIKVLAPLSGGDIALKFENYNNSSSHEIVMTPVPGQWTDVEFDFSGLSYNNLTRMVIFPDFKGTTPGINWYIDDILKEIPEPLELESNLPIIVINTYGVSISDGPKITGHMGIIDHGHNLPNNLHDPFTNYAGAIGIEIRGNSTQLYPKKSYAVETRDDAGENLDVSLLGMPQENDWILYAPYSDKSMLRNLVSFEMGHKMGNYCSRMVFCELVLNNDYKGVYILMEKIKKDNHRVDIATLNPDEISGDDLTGGYIIKVDKLDWGFTYGVDGWKSYPAPPYPNAMNITFQYYYPDSEEIVSEQRSYIRNFITTAENTLTSHNFIDPDNGYQKYFDVLSFVDFMILSEISKEVDKYKYSTYFYKDKDSNGGKLFAGPAWDFNFGYGNVDYWPPGIDHTGWMYPLTGTWEPSNMFWWKRLMEDAWFKNLAKTRWTWFRQNQLNNGAIHAVIDSVLAYTGVAKDRNYHRWPILGEYVWPNYNWMGNTYADEVAYFEDFLFNRLSWMDANFPGSVLHPWAGISAEGYKIRVILYGDYFCRHDLKKSHFRLNNAPAGIEIQDVVYINASECLLFVSANLSAFPESSVTISEKEVNYWEDITSNSLGSSGTGDHGAILTKIGVFEEDHLLHIRCNEPEKLPDYTEIISLAGQSLGKFKLEKKVENILPHQLKPGLYLMIIKTENAPVVLKFSVGK